MNHLVKAQLLVLMDENPADLSDVELNHYIWLVEQLLQETRELLVHRRGVAVNPDPLRR